MPGNQHCVNQHNIAVYTIATNTNSSLPLPPAAQVTSYPDKIYDALYASVSVLRELRTSIITDRDLQRAKRTLLTRHESDLKTNVYWLGLLTHLQNSKVSARACWRCLLLMVLGCSTMRGG